MATITSDGKITIQQDHESKEMPINVPSESSPEPTAASINSKSLLVTRLPADVRFLIYDILMSQKHEIEYCTWSPYLCNPSILGPLQASCTSIRQEIDTWYEHKTKSKAGLLRNLVFGIFNPETTSFWKRIFPCNVNEVVMSGGFLNQDMLQNYPVESSVLPPFASSNDIRCVPNVSDGSPQTEEGIEKIFSLHKRHWKYLSNKTIAQ